MNNDLISRQAAIDAMSHVSDSICGAQAIEALSELPTIDPVKHGKWMRTPTGWAYCSVCGMEPPNESNETTDYCPNCGARMDKEE